MFRTLLAIIREYKKLYKTIAECIGFLHVEELLEIFWCRIYSEQNCAQ